MLATHGAFQVECVWEKPRVIEFPWGVRQRFRPTGLYPDCSVSKRLHKRPAPPGGALKKETSGLGLWQHEDMIS
jgi:hypothetical protein